MKRWIIKYYLCPETAHVTRQDSSAGDGQRVDQAWLTSSWNLRSTSTRLLGTPMSSTSTRLLGTCRRVHKHKTAWDMSALIFSWNEQEPGQNSVSCLRQILLALSTLSSYSSVLLNEIEWKPCFCLFIWIHYFIKIVIFRLCLLIELVGGLRGGFGLDSKVWSKE